VQRDAEHRVLVGLADYDLRDIFRQLHGHDVQAWSWRQKQGDRWVIRRYDHVFASTGLGATAFHYLNKHVQDELSDHAPVIVDFAPRL
jgi:exonuclease III